jgi:hypothetical protein
VIVFVTPNFLVVHHKNFAGLVVSDSSPSSTSSRGLEPLTIKLSSQNQALCIQLLSTFLFLKTPTISDNYLLTLETLIRNFLIKIMTLLTIRETSFVAFAYLQDSIIN